MIVTAIYGTEHVGSTVHLSRMAIETLQPDEVHEFFLPRDFHHMCTGCNACFFCTSCLLRACARSNCTHSGCHRPSRCAHPCISCLRLSRHRRNEILFGSLWLPLDAAPSQPIHVHQTSASADNSRRRRNAPYLAGFAGQYEFLGCGARGTPRQSYSCTDLGRSLSCHALASGARCTEGLPLSARRSSRQTSPVCAPDVRFLSSSAAAYEYCDRSAILGDARLVLRSQTLVNIKKTA